MKHITTAALLLTLGVATGYAHERPVKMSSSGTSAGSTVDLKIPGTTTGENNFAGKGTLGSYTFREIEAETGRQAPPQLVFWCEFPLHHGGGGSGRISLPRRRFAECHPQGRDRCIDLDAQQAHCTRTFKVISGTGRFKDAKGVLEFVETIGPVLADATGNPIFFASTGEFTGTISGVERDAEHDEQP